MTTIRELADRAADLSVQVEEVKAELKAIFDGTVKPLDEKAKGIASIIESVKAEIAPLALAHYAETNEKTIGGIVVKDETVHKYDSKLVCVWLMENGMTDAVEVTYRVRDEKAIRDLLLARRDAGLDDGLIESSVRKTVTFPTSEKGWRK